MRTIIAGGRDFCDYTLLDSALAACPWDISVVISGTARGADTLGECWARNNNIQVERFPADWTKFGKRAGYLRNQEMAEHAECLVAFWDGISPGTKHMIKIAKMSNLKVLVIPYGGKSVSNF